MIVYDVATKVLGTEVFPQHNIADLSITFIVLFIEEKLLRWKETNTDTYTQSHKPSSEEELTIEQLGRFCNIDDVNF